MVEQSVTDFSPGPMKNTGIETDFAVRGRGFFVVDHGGKQMLTRAGNFQRTAEGMLITPDGDPVLSEEGSPAIVNGPFQFREDGTFFTNEGFVRLAVAEPASLGDLVKIGENLFEPMAKVGALPDELRSVAQGFIETSGVVAVNEMVDMIATTRAFEANVNMIDITIKCSAR